MTNQLSRLGSLRLTASAAAILLAAAQVAPAYAAIDNTATASGTYNGNTTTSTGDSESVPVVPAAPALSMEKSAGVPTVNLGTSTTIADAGDTITYTYTITNTGNVTVSNVTPVDLGPTFNGVAGTGTLGGFTLTSAGGTTLDPGETATFEAVYTLSTLDVLRSADITDGVSNTATASGTNPQGGTFSSAPDTATATIPAGPALTISKAAVLTEAGLVDGLAAVGDTITYTYTITNTGNVPLSNVAVSDTHEGAVLASSVFGDEALASDGPLAPTVTSSDATADNGVWTTLQPGAVVTITYVHTVTQTEVDNQ